MATLAPMVVSVKIRNEREVKAEALREAADALFSVYGPERLLPGIAAWLRDRATALEDDH